MTDLLAPTEQLANQDQSMPRQPDNVFYLVGAVRDSIRHMGICDSNTSKAVRTKVILPVMDLPFVIREDYRSSD